MYEAVLYIAVAHILLYKLNDGYQEQAHFMNIFQTEHFLAVKFDLSYEKNMSLILRKISKSLKK